MQPLGRLLLVFLLAFGFQAGIATSAASGIKFGALKTLCVEVIAEPGTAESEGLAAETPWPSCKSMTTAFGAEFEPPSRIAGGVARIGADHLRGGWRILRIDEPPKRLPTTG